MDEERALDADFVGHPAHREARARAAAALADDDTLEDLCPGALAFCDSCADTNSVAWSEFFDFQVGFESYVFGGFHGRTSCEDGFRFN